ncbi:unnamed protein product [Sphenostylis stenocarpa]|uniref:Uncharacterized protein n=1 Tax=Sphenostylis stenocarpa TaxID=92480 RepID=A0AA86VZX0_9FABA|nr:unnamed protein product [Sphenostylis stenocarpa]
MVEGENVEIETEAESEASSAWNLGKHTQIIELSEKLLNGNLAAKIEAAREIRKMVRKSSSSTKIRAKLAAVGVIEPLVLMLSSSNIDARQSSLLALLNLAVRNERGITDELLAAHELCDSGTTHKLVVPKPGRV